MGGAVALATTKSMKVSALKYLNRLSGGVCVAARIAKNDGQSDVLWDPKMNR